MEEYNSEFTGQQIDDAVSRALPGGDIDMSIQKKPNPNLLDNWYFGNPVDQRGGYVTKKDTMAYSDTGVSTEVGPTYGIYKATPISGTVASFVNVDGITFYCKLSDCVHGYTGAGYGIDRCILQATTSCALIINDGYITLYAKDNDGLLQKFPAEQFSIGDTITVSVLTDTELLSKTITLTESVQVYPYDNSIWNMAVGKINGIWYVWVLITYDQSTEQAINIKAAKLELGSQQTLAHQDADGNWVLNEIPDYGEQLRRCQREYINLYQNESLGILVSGSHFGNLSVAAFDIPVPVTMRAKPVITDVVSYGNLVLMDGTNISVRNVIVDCTHASSIRVFVNNTGSTVFGPASLVDFKFCFAAYI